jgi:hypothetical protein
MRKALLLALLLALATTFALPADAQNWRTMTSSRRLLDRQHHEVEIEYGAGTLRVLPAAAQHLYRMEVRYADEGSRPVAEYDAGERHLRLGTDSEDFNRKSVQWAEEASATIELSRQVPLDLELRFGAGKAEIELGGLSLRQVTISTGASDTRVSFGEMNPIAAEEVEIEAGAAELHVIGLGNSRAQRVEFKGGVGSTVLDFSGASGNMEAEIEMGVGSLTLRLPRSHGVRVERSAFLSTFSAPDLIRDGNSYVSRDWASATQRLSIDVSAALGSIEIEWVE